MMCKTLKNCRGNPYKIIKQRPKPTENTEEGKENQIMHQEEQNNMNLITGKFQVSITKNQ